jgi:hypothetical protein
MNIREKISSVIVGAKKYFQQTNYEEHRLESVFQDQFFLEFYYLYPNVSSATFAAKTDILQTKIDQYTMEKYGLEFFQLCNKHRIEHFLSKNSIVFTEDNFGNFSLKGTGFTNTEEFKNAYSIYASISLN